MELEEHPDITVPLYFAADASCDLLFVSTDDPALTAVASHMAANARNLSHFFTEELHDDLQFVDIGSHTLLFRDVSGLFVGGIFPGRPSSLTDASYALEVVFRALFMFVGPAIVGRDPARAAHRHRVLLRSVIARALALLARCPGIAAGEGVERASLAAELGNELGKAVTAAHGVGVGAVVAAGAGASRLALGVVVGAQGRLAAIRGMPLENIDILLLLALLHDAQGASLSFVADAAAGRFASANNSVDDDDLQSDQGVDGRAALLQTPALHLAGKYRFAATRSPASPIMSPRMDLEYDESEDVIECDLGDIHTHLVVSEEPVPEIPATLTPISAPATAPELAPPPLLPVYVLEHGSNGTKLIKVQLAIQTFHEIPFAVLLPFEPFSRPGGAAEAAASAAATAAATIKKHLEAALKDHSDMLAVKLAAHVPLGPFTTRCPGLVAVCASWTGKWSVKHKMTRKRNSDAETAAAAAAAACAAAISSSPVVIAPTLTATTYNPAAALSDGRNLVERARKVGATLAIARSGAVGWLWMRRRGRGLSREVVEVQMCFAAMLTDEMAVEWANELVNMLGDVVAVC